MTTTTKFHLRAITDESITKVHLGATERDNRTFCGVQLLVEDDPRFGGRYKGIAYTASADLAAVDCGACKRSAAWKGQKNKTYAVPVPKPKTAQDQAKRAADQVSGSSVIDADPDTGLPRIKPEVQAKADNVVAIQRARNAEAGK